MWSRSLTAGNCYMILSKAVPLWESPHPLWASNGLEWWICKFLLLTFQDSSPFLLGAQWPLGKYQFPPGLAPPSCCATHFSDTSRKFWAGRCVPRKKWQEVG